MLNGFWDGTDGVAPVDDAIPAATGVGCDYPKHEGRNTSAQVDARLTGLLDSLRVIICSPRPFSHERIDSVNEA
jgi:hypothetical protein